jgi:hypothetical protein
MGIGTLHWLAGREFWRGFGWTAPGGRDFLLLCLALAGLLGIAGILLAARHGVVDGLAYSLIGGGSGADLPIAVRRPVGQPGFEANPALQARFGAVTIAAPGSASARAATDAAPPAGADGESADTARPPALTRVTLAPYWVLEFGEGDAGFPAEAGVWPAAVDDGSAPSELLGWALPATDPLWAWVAQHRANTAAPPPAPGGRGARAGAPARQRANAAAPLPGRDDALHPWLVLNRAAFRQFDYAAYRAWLKRRLPAPIFAAANLPDWPLDATAGGSAAPTLDHLYLEWRLGEGVPELVRFDVVWVDGLPVTDQVAYLMPLDLLHAAEAAKLGSGIRYYPETGANDADPKRLTSLRVQGLGRSSTEQKAAAIFQEMAQCLGVSAADLRDGLRPSLPWAWYRACASVVGLSDERFTIDPATRPAHPLRAPRPLVLGGVPCNLLRDRPCLSVHCSDAAGNPHDERLCEAYLLGHRPAFLANVLAPTRALLDAAVLELELARDARREPLFYLDPNYRNALERFRFVLALVAWGQWPVALGLFGFGAYVLGLVIHGLVEHRRAHYGLLLTRGVSVDFLRALLGWQITLAVALAGGVAALLLLGVQALVNLGFTGTEAAAIGQSLGAGGQQVLVMPAPLELLLLLGLTWLVSLLLVLLVMGLNGIHANCEPIDLLK